MVVDQINMMLKRDLMWGSQSWLQPPFEAAPRWTTETDQAANSLTNKKPPERRLQPRLAAPRHGENEEQRVYENLHLVDGAGQWVQQEQSC